MNVIIRPKIGEDCTCKMLNKALILLVCQNLIGKKKKNTEENKA